MNVLFGNHQDFTAEIDRYIDKSAFVSTYGWNGSTSFENFACVIPILLSDYHDLRSRGTGENYIIPAADVVSLCDDKLLLNIAACEKGFAAFIPPLMSKDERTFPYILKRRRDENGHNSKIVANDEDEGAVRTLLEDDNYFLQHCAEGRDEFAAHILMVGGVARYSMTVHHTMPKDLYVKSGVGEWPVDSRCIGPDPFLDAFSRLLASIGYEGLCCIDYKLTADGPKVLEVNPRFGFTVSWDINNYIPAYAASLNDRRAD